MYLTAFITSSLYICQQKTHLLQYISARSHVAVVYTVQWYLSKVALKVAKGAAYYAYCCSYLWSKVSSVSLAAKWHY